ncbi:glutamate receptor ionotropic, kainate 2-like isoform X2 [Argiope bruennichi]|uniref:glutamate receptor ionotropic, kainate 2-like isoform X2 n=1 Tax=Argiope bruennichi TaxID=94029 RepID=UPI0024944BB2|nr:glutamate receptor ionotropic, kainate 2-like isoform X2 [Argiope bruennichi]
MRCRRRRIWIWLLQVITVSVLISSVTALPEVIKIGGLFETNDNQDLAFRKAIEMINTDESKLPRAKLQAKVREVAPQDSFRALKTACDFLEEGMAAIIGPKSPSNIGVLHSICDTFQIPLFLTHWAPRSTPRNQVINLFPDSRVLATAFTEFIKQDSWKSFTLIFEDNEALIRLQEILQLPTSAKQSQMKITLRHVKPDQDFTKFMKDLSKLRETNFVVDLPLHRVRELFIAADKLNMMTEYQRYLLTSLDVHTVDWSQSIIGRSNITAFRLINPNNEEYKRFLDEWIFSEQTAGKEISSKQPITTEAALLYDAVLLLSRALYDLDRGNPITPKSLFCDGSDVWEEGRAIANYITKVPMEGASGSIKLNLNGQRTTFSLDIIKVTKRGIVKTGSWDTEKRFTYKKEEKDAFSDAKDLLKNATLKVTTIINNPYMMKKLPENAYTGNDRYEGYCKDLLEKLSEKFGFKFIIQPVKDGGYGALKDGEWNGMVGELLKREADIAVADLSITFDRESAVDFTMPFMNLGISILFKKPAKKNPPLFSFFQPLSIEVWFYMATAYLGITLYLFILARLSPYEWIYPSPQRPDSNVVENRFTLTNSLWFMMGSLMRRGCDFLPRAISTRMVASSWWFFTLIMISSYTANLAAFLTAQRMTSPIESAADLAKQTAIQYGCVYGGSTMNFFRTSTYPIYKRMWSFMESQRPSVFPEDNYKGIERVKMGNYAFLMESTSIEYVTERNCDLTRIGGELDSKGYGIATPPGSPYRGILSSGILALQESQQLQILKDKWWKATQKCPDDSGSSSAEMGIRNVGGVFLVLGIGSILGAIIVILEFVWKANKMLDRESIPVMLWHELKATLSFRGSTRPAPKDEEEPSVEKMPMVNMGKIEDFKFS